MGWEPKTKEGQACETRQVATGPGEDQSMQMHAGGREDDPMETRRDLAESRGQEGRLGKQ